MKYHKHKLQLPKGISAYHWKQTRYYSENEPVSQQKTNKKTSQKNSARTRPSAVNWNEHTRPPSHRCYLEVNQCQIDIKWRNNNTNNQLPLLKYANLNPSGVNAEKPKSALRGGQRLIDVPINRTDSKKCWEIKVSPRALLSSLCALQLKRKSFNKTQGST